MKAKLPVTWATPIDAESEDESILLCPVCESPGDYCPDVHHWMCEDCDELLEEEYDQAGDAFWVCPTCSPP